MPSFPKLLISFLFLLLFKLCLIASPNENKKIYHNEVYKPNIKTLIFGIKGVALSYPFISLGSPTPLQLSFDELGEANSNLSYRIIHCNADWSPSMLKGGEFIDGYPKAPIQNYDYSFNTIYPYTHFSLEIPNQQMQFTRSGNYIVEVYNTYDESDIYLRQRFIIYEELVKLKGRVKMPDRMSIRDAYQEVDFTAYDQNFPYNNPQKEVEACIVQNGNWGNAVTGLRPRFIRPGELVFDYDTTNVFPGGNEYRLFDLRDLSYQSPRVYVLDKKQTPFYVQLYRDKSRLTQAYTTYDDLNGNAYIDNIQGNAPEFDADYLEVLFSLKTDYPFNEGDLFLDGNWMGSSCREEYKMRYNKQRQHYEVKVPVKQGFYSYRYVLKEDHEPIKPFLEGSFWQTENQYHIFVYFRGISDESDRVIGFLQINSVLN